MLGIVGLGDRINRVGEEGSEKTMKPSGETKQKKDRERICIKRS